MYHYDISKESLENARSTIHKNLNRMLAKELITELEIKPTNNLIYSNKLDDISTSELVIEAITENYEAKAVVFKKLEVIAMIASLLRIHLQSQLQKFQKIYQKIELLGCILWIRFLLKLVEVINGSIQVQK